MKIEKKKLIIWCSIITVCIILIVVLALNRKANKKPNIEETDNTNIEEDYTDYYTIKRVTDFKDIYEYRYKSIIDGIKEFKNGEVIGSVDGTGASKSIESRVFNPNTDIGKDIDTQLAEYEKLASSVWLVGLSSMEDINNIIGACIYSGYIEYMRIETYSYTEEILKGKDDYIRMVMTDNYTIIGRCNEISSKTAKEYLKQED